MAGKKKKSLANKLAKMSDEERARYLQHRAEIEEEAKRRKEQLIATFMKKKIKKEDGFGRLNLAKINQNWHQILRKIKVKEMKEEVEHLKRWIERLLDYKNNRIAKLLEELEDAEEQYSNNFKYHCTHMDTVIDSQNKYINDLQMQYEKDLNEFLKECKDEESEIVENAEREITYLKTIIFGQDIKAGKQLKENKEGYSQQLYAAEYNNKVKMARLRKTRGDVENALWQQLFQVIRFYVQKTDVRRSHLQELRRIDAESAEEIRKNEDKINGEEAMIKTLNNNYAYLLTVRTEKIKNLQIEEKGLKERFLNVKKCLKSNLALDETKLRILTSYSTNCLDYMCGLLSRGKQLVSLSDTCKKFETEREKVIKWLPLTKLVVLDGIEGGLTDDEKLYQRTVDEGFVLPKLKSATRSSASEEKSKTRPTTTSGIYRLIKSDTTETEADVDTLEFKKYAPIENVKFEAKKSEDFEEEQIEMVHSVELSSPRDKDVLDRCCENLEKMENFWILYNKVVVDVLELKEERNVLEKENKQMRGFIRAILEAAALAKSIPDSRVSTRVHSQRGAYSAPLKRIVFH